MTPPDSRAALHNLFPLQAPARAQAFESFIFIQEEESPFNFWL